MPPSATVDRRIPEVIPQRYEANVPLSQLHPHPANPNSGDLGLLAGLIDANGFAVPILAQESTGIIVDGEHRLIAARQAGMTHLPVVWLDCDDDTRDRLLASLNEATRRGMNDESKLIALLTGLAGTPKGLAGAAFDGDDLDDMIARANPGEPPERGELLDAAGVTVGEPRHQPEKGQTWQLGPHVLVIADVFTGWAQWTRYLTGDAVFMPYPTPLLPHGEDLPGPLVMVQPILFLAGHLLDKWEDVTKEPPRQLTEAEQVR
jgi:ParB-like nuclease domain